MTIYTLTTITESIRSKFRPTRLYIKELAGIKYFGKTSVDDIFSYTGSGKVWADRIKKYGKENIKTIWVSDWYFDPAEIQEIAVHFSHENSIVESKEWANLKIEDGLSGGHCGPIGSEKITNANKRRRHSSESNEKRRQALLGEKNHNYGKTGPLSARFGKKDSEETRKRKSRPGEKNSMYGLKGESNPNFGSKRSDEQKNNIKRSLRKLTSDETIILVQKMLSEGELTQREIAKLTGIKESVVSRIKYGKITVLGYRTSHET